MPMDRPERCCGEEWRVRRILSLALVADLAAQNTFQGASNGCPFFRKDHL